MEHSFFILSSTIATRPFLQITTEELEELHIRVHWFLNSGLISLTDRVLTMSTFLDFGSCSFGEVSDQFLSNFLVHVHITLHTQTT